MPSRQTVSSRPAVPVLALAAALLVSSGACRQAATPPFDRTASTASPAALAIDTAEARRAFENNIDAIHTRDRARYLASYLQTETLARTGPAGLELGFEGWPARRDSTWPDTLVARDLRLVPISPGVVYGTYHYRVTAGGATTEGISERVFVRTTDGWKIAVSTAFGLPEGASPPPLAIVGATLVNPEAEPVPNAVVLTRAGRIACAGTRAQCPLPAGIATVDATGAYVGPGLIDAHVHYSQTGWVDGRPDAIDLRAEHPYDSVVGVLARNPERYHRAWLCSGVTSVFDVGGYTFTYDLARGSRVALDAPRIVAAGPLLSTIDHWLNLPASKVILEMTSDSMVRATVRAHRSLGASAIKLWNIQLPDSLARRMKPRILAAGEEARAVGLPLIVHATELPRAKEALEAGATVLVHSVMTGEIDDEFIAAAKRRGTIVVPTLTVFEGYADVFLGRSPSARYPLECVDPATRALLERQIPEARRTNQAAFVRSGAWERQAETMVRNLRRMREAGIPIAMGTDAGNPGTAHGPSVYREMEAMQSAGMPAREVFASATIVAARAMGIADEAGSVAAGKRADLVLFDADPTADIANARRVRTVVRNGARYDRAELLRAATRAD
jgi:imidazolonepropionase-like amidohydrolase